jgi:hypothetical protein
LRALAADGEDQIRRTIARGEKAVGLGVSRTAIPDAGRVSTATAAGAASAAGGEAGGVGVEDWIQQSCGAAVIFRAGCGQQ